MIPIIQNLRGTTLVLLVLFYLHGVGLFLFIRGFLLSRLSLSNISDCSPIEKCTLPATHKRAVVLIIDALRFDFISPDAPTLASPYHHNILTLPAELTAKHPQNSFIFHAYSDPPTTTLQRIKGITTGSLPTFVEMGQNFGGSEIEEDSIIRQLRRRGKKLAFMGDDTWMMVFPRSFEANMTHPFDSFNVEDLHTVDNGVIANIFPLLQMPKQARSWDFIVGHFLGVDHVGHRLGPDHPTMKTKLNQMDDILRGIVNLLEDDTLLVLLGDHGMDLRGDHGGDSEHETSSALWIYSKSVPLSSPNADYSAAIPKPLRSEYLFPGMSHPHRSVQQIDLVPTLSLLLGLPIPFNNLGAVIPELFLRGESPDEEAKLLERALQLNSEQVQAYLRAYRESSSGGELDPYWDELYMSFHRSSFHDRPGNARALHVRSVLDTCRKLWAQFDSVLMIFGLSIIAGSILASASLYTSLARLPHASWDSRTRQRMESAVLTAFGGMGVAVTSVVFSVPRSFSLALWLSGLTIVATIILSTLPSFRRIPLASEHVILIMHTVSFFSNSFVFWEDRIIPYLYVAAILPVSISGLKAHSSRLRWRILGFGSLSAVCSRLMSVSTVCREEQQPYCHVTFYASSSVAAAPIAAIIAILPIAFLLPTAVRRFLHISKSDSGPAGLFIDSGLRVSLLCGSACWLLEYAQTVSLFGEGSNVLLRTIRSIIARFAIGGFSVLSLYLWWKSGLCLEVAYSNPLSGRREVQVYGFANTFGSSLLLFVGIWFALVWATTQLVGQIVLALGLVALLSWLEVVDSVRDCELETTLASKKKDDATKPTQPPLRFGDMLPICLLALQMFHGTGHQSTLTSIQWKSAFLLTEKLVYPISPVLVALNSFGPLILIGLSSPLVALWNVPPLPHPEQSNVVERGALRAALALVINFGCLLLGSAASAAWLRRHLMVWKVFAPRFMAAAAGLVAVDLGLAISLLIGLPVVLRKVANNRVLVPPGK